MIKVVVVASVLAQVVSATEWTTDGISSGGIDTSLFAPATNVVTLSGNIILPPVPPYITQPQFVRGRLDIDGISIGKHNQFTTEVQLRPSGSGIHLKIDTPSRTGGPGNAGNIILAPGIAFTGGTNGKVIVQSDLQVDGQILGNLAALTNAPFYYALQFVHGAVSPTDNTSYFIGAVADLPPTTLQESSRTIYTHASGFIRRVSIHHSVGGNVATTEQSTFKVVNLTKGTESVITSNYLHVNAHWATNFILSTPLRVDAGDALTIVWEAPAWETNPTHVRNNFVVTVER